MNSRFGPTVKQIWKIAMNVLYSLQLGAFLLIVHLILLARQLARQVATDIDHLKQTGGAFKISRIIG